MPVRFYCLALLLCLFLPLPAQAETGASLFGTFGTSDMSVINEFTPGESAVEASAPQGNNTPLSTNQIRAIISRLDAAKPSTREQPPEAARPETDATKNATGNGPWSAPDAVSPDAAPSKQTGKPKQPSALETLYRTMYGSREARHLRQFGYSLFSRSGRNAALPKAPPPDYILGPGDVLRLSVTSQTGGLDTETAIRNDGRILLPRLGDVPLAGVTYDRAEQTLARAIHRHLPGAEVSASLTRMRSLAVYVIGEVNTPGLTVVPALSTVMDGLYAAGGVRKSGSLRRIRLRRDEREIAAVDLYDLLLRGRRKGDVFLKDRDVIFVPRIGPTAAVAGAVAQPGIFELPSQITAVDLLRMAGGPLPQGLTSRLHLLRFGPDRAMRIQDFAWGELSRPPAKSRLSHPPSHPSAPNKRLAQPHRVPGPGRNPGPQRKAANDTTGAASLPDTMPVHDGDLLVVRYKERGMPQVVRLEGHVWTPETLHFRPGLHLSDLLDSPAQLRPDAITDFALLVRYDPATTLRRVQTFPLSRLFSGAYDLDLAPHDTIVVLSRKEFGIEQNITIQGAVWREGSYAYTEGMTLVDLLALGGGLRFGANPKRIELTRKVLSGQTARTTFHTLRLDQDRDVSLEPFDTVFVPRIKDSDSFLQVVIQGEVARPGPYRIRRGEKLSDLLRRAGGFTDDAYFHGAVYTSRRARRIQQKSIDHLVRRLELSANRLLLEQAQTASSMEEAEGAKSAMRGMELFFDKLKSVKAEGRVVIRLTDLQTFGGSRYDFTLEDGDKLVIPGKPSFVSVVGSVYSPNSLLYQNGLRVCDALEKCGGPTDNADPDHMYVLRANGEVLSRLTAHNTGERFSRYRLMPGDTLVVPEDLGRVPYFRLVKGVTDIIFKIATTAGVVVALL